MLGAGMLSIDVDHLEDELTAVLGARGACRLDLAPGDALLLAGALQLACRQPEMPTLSRGVAAAFVEVVVAYFAACPTALALLQLGDRERPS